MWIVTMHAYTCISLKKGVLEQLEPLLPDVPRTRIVTRALRELQQRLEAERQGRSGGSEVAETPA